MIVVAILAVVAIPQFVNFGSDAKDAVSRTRLKEIRMAIVGDPQAIAGGVYTKAGFEKDLAALPTALSELGVIGAYPAYDPFTKIGWRGPYVDTSVPDWNKDAWGTTFSYSAGGRTLTSYGPDKASGGGDDITVSF